ncbi:MAG: sensor histidine kinase, partial [Jiangellaceae bacterium]
MTRNPRGHRSSKPGVAQRGARPDERAAAAAPAAASRRPRPPRLASIWRAFLHDRSVRSRVGALVLLPLLGALILGAFLFRDAFARAANAGDVEASSRASAAALAVVGKLQDERDVSGLFDVDATGQGAVAQARDGTDDAIDALREAMDDLPENGIDPAVAEARRVTETQLGLLDAYRGSRDIELEPYDDPGVEDYHLMVEGLLRFVKASGSGSTDSSLVLRIDTLDSMARATESASVERGLLGHVLASGEPLTEAQRQRQAVFDGEQDFLFNRFNATADREAKALYYAGLPGVRGPVDDIRAAALQVDERPGVTPEAWYQASTDRITVLRSIQDTLSGEIVEQAASTATRAQIVAAATAAAIVVVLAATVAMAAAVARSIIRPLRRLRGAALEADIGLPALVSRIHSDGPAVIRNLGDAVRPEGADEIGEVATAFNAVHSTAVRVAGEQALLRQNLDTIVVNLSRRTQGLVDRQLGEIEDLEARERDPDQLGTLFRIDHMATRVRRHAESLLVLAGVEEMRRTGTAAPVLDVVRTAVGEVEQYPRVKFGVMPTDLVTPTAVDDVAHLLAELLDNATEFSAPSTPVMVTSQPLLGGGLRLQVADQGLGIPANQIVELNRRLREPGDIDVAASRTLGLYVVARLAARHGIVVRLVPGEPGGTIAQVDLPAHLVVSPLDTSDGVLPPVQAQPVAAPPLLGGVPIEEQVRRAVEQNPPARPLE